MKIIALLLISFFFFLLTYFGSSGDFSNKDLFFIAILSLIVIFSQSLILVIFKSKNNIGNVLFSIFCFINIYSLHLALIPGFINMSFIYLVGIFLLGSFIFFTLAKIISETKLGGIATVIFSLIACIGVSANNYAQSSAYSKNNMTALAEKSTGLSPQQFNFTKKPNVYFISFDSLIPKVLMSKHMGIESNKYHDVLDENFSESKNMFADAVSTKRSLNTLLALDPDYFRELEAAKDGSHLEMYTGNFPSPFFQVFSNNGYESNTLFNSRYFGPQKGEFLDNYWINRDVSVCDFFDLETIGVSFFGYCKINNPKVFDKPNTFNRFLSKFAEDPKQDPVSFLLSSIKAGLDKSEPQVFVAYVYSPGHTKMTFQTGNEKDLEEYKQKYIKNSDSAAQNIAQIVNFMKKNDPEGIVVIFGDHGPWLSRSVALNDDPEFFIQDRYGIYGGIYPKATCKDHLESTRGFSTISTLANGVINCLSNKTPDKLGQKPLYPIFKETTKTQYKYEDFLYE